MGELDMGVGGRELPEADGWVCGDTEELWLLHEKVVDDI